MHDRCNYCMTRTLENGVCTQCGKASTLQNRSSDMALPPGTLLVDQKQFLIGQKLGHGGFGITYVGMDMDTEERVAIKEFMPKHIVNAREETALAVPPDRREEYDKFLRSFHREANTIHLLKKHPAIVEVKYLLETNQTAYIVMEMLEGMDLGKFLGCAGKLSARQAFELLSPIMDALIFTHKSGVLHRDISPDNIFLCMERSAQKKPHLGDVVALKLIDFGAAHVAVADFTHSFPGVRKSGYSPLEQNWDAVHQGTWTDVYAFAATFYYAITKEVPPVASERSGDTDSLKPPSRLGAHISPEAEQVLLKGMAVGRKNRYQTMKEFYSDLQGAIFPEFKPVLQAEASSAKVDGSTDEPMHGEPSQPAEQLTLQTFFGPQAFQLLQKSLTHLRLMAVAKLQAVARKLRSLAREKPLAFFKSLKVLVIPKSPGSPKSKAPAKHLKVPIFSKRLLGELSVFQRRMLAYSVDWVLLQGSMLLLLRLPGFLVGWLLMVVVNTGLEFTGRHASIGKMLLQIRLCNDSAADQNPTLSQTVLHNLCCATVPFLAMETLLMMVTKTHQLMHDQLLKTDVCLMGEAAAPVAKSLPRPVIRIFFVEGSFAGKEYRYQRDVRIGRDSEMNDLVIPADGQISKQHCRIFHKAGHFFLKDEGSRNGTWLNGARLSGQPQKLKNSDTIKIGRELFRVRIDM